MFWLIWSSNKAIVRCWGAPGFCRFPGSQLWQSWLRTVSWRQVFPTHASRGLVRTCRIPQNSVTFTKDHLLQCHGNHGSSSTSGGANWIIKKHKPHVLLSLVWLIMLTGERVSPHLRNNRIHLAKWLGWPKEAMRFYAFYVRSLHMPWFGKDPTTVAWLVPGNLWTSN